MDNIEELINKLPDNLELSYDTVEHNKVQTFNVCMAIPEGKRCLLWFTFHNKHKVAALCHLDKTHKVTYITSVPVVFHEDLCLGTIFSGNLFHYKNSKFFAIDDIHYYKGKNKERTDTNSKLKLLSYIMNHEIKQKTFTKYDLVVGLPLMHTNRRTLMEKFDILPYKITSIKYFPHDRHQAPYYSPFNQVSYTNTFPNAPTAIFKVSADNQYDIYNLFCYSKGKTDYFYGTAFVPDFNTSVMLNNLFRNIRENKNLDYLEESDDDEDFENTREDKYVMEGKQLNMLCYYNYRFKKWVPSKVLRGGKLCNLYELREMEKNNFGHQNRNTNIKYKSSNTYEKKYQFKNRFHRK